MNKTDFIDICKKNLYIDITNEILAKLNKYYELLKIWNEKFNLTRIIDELDVYLKHYYDSLCIVKTSLIKNEELLLCDLGTGAGFPGIVIKIVFPNINVTLIESNAKKCTFLNEIIKGLSLKDIKVINERIEIYAKTNREIYDVVTCRAVSSLKIVTELAIPLLKINGCFVPLKANIEEELIDSKDIMKCLDSNLEKLITYELPIEKSIRNIPIIKKNNKTNIEYPREYNKIVK